MKNAIVALVQNYLFYWRPLVKVFNYFILTVLLVVLSSCLPAVVEQTITNNNNSSSNDPSSNKNELLPLGTNDPEPAGGTDLTSCAAYLADDPSSIDGYYQIDYDNNTLTPSVTAYCDMTNGGWMRIINDNTTTISDLSVFGDTSDIAASYNNTAYGNVPVYGTYGVGWGEANALNCFDVVNVPAFTQVKLKVSARSEVLDCSLGLGGCGNTGGFGYLQISANSSNPEEFLSLYDAWSNMAWGGNRLYVNGVILVDKTSYAHIDNYPVVATYSGTHLNICMGGDSTGGWYSPRFIQDLWIK